MNKKMVGETLDMDTCYFDGCDNAGSHKAGRVWICESHHLAGGQNPPDLLLCRVYLGNVLTAYLCDFESTSKLSDGSKITPQALDRIQAAARIIEILLVRYSSPVNIQAWFRGSNNILGDKPLKYIHDTTDYAAVRSAATQHI